MNLKTRYLGMDLAHPIMPGASSLTGDLPKTREAQAKVRHIEVKAG